MNTIFIDENNKFQIDFSKAVWTNGSLRDTFENANTILSDVDFIAETPDNVMIFLEYKNASIQGASHPEKFQMRDIKLINKLARKYYDSMWYLMSEKKGYHKRKEYICILEAPLGSRAARKAVRNDLHRKLPFKLQVQNTFDDKLIDVVKVLSIDEWNEQYGELFPAKLLEE